MNLIDKNDTKSIEAISMMHYDAYHEKLNEDLISDNFDDYVKSTIDDLEKRKVYLDKQERGLIVCEDRTDNLIKNSTYHLVTRIYVKPEFRKQGIAKEMINFVLCELGQLMGWNGKFYKIKEPL